MYLLFLKSITIAVGVDSPKEAAEWYLNLLELDEVIQFEDVYEVALNQNTWLQFYYSEHCAKNFVLRLEVDELQIIKKKLVDLGYANIRMNSNETVKYMYSIQDPYGNKVGFYNIYN